MSEAEGTMTPEEATSFLQANLTSLDKEKAAMIVEIMDLDSDNKIDTTELDKLLDVITEADKKLRSRFEDKDPEKTGLVSKEDAKSIMGEFIKGIPEKTIDNMLLRYDLDGNGKFDFNEFIIFYSYSKVKKEYLEKKFEELDIDKDKDLSVDELVDVLREKLCIEEGMVRGMLSDHMGDDEKMSMTEFKLFYANLVE